MKKNSLILLLTILLFSSFNKSFSQSAGFNTTYAVLSLNGSSNLYYDLQATTANPDFQGAVLGSFSSSNSLLLKGSEHNVYKCGGCDLTSTRLYYRVYLTGSIPGSFSNLNIGYSSGFTNGCGGEDQQWSDTSYSTNLLSGLTPGNYTVELYSEASVTCSGGTVYAGNLGLNYKATFDFCGDLSGPLTPGNYSIPGCFSSIASAATYLNTNGVSGAGVVQFDVEAGYTEVAPSTGILFRGVGSAGNLATGNSILEIVFKKSGIGANPKITAPLWASGGNADGIIKISGSDYLTFDGLTIEENPGNTNLSTSNTMTEVGIGIFIGTSVNGAQHNTIKNCTISLNQDYPNSIGIFSTSSSAASGGSNAATSSLGTNSFNTIDSNTISNVAYGVLFITPPATSAILETGNLITGNTINFGNITTSTATWSRFPTTTMAAITYRNGTDVTINNNNCTSAALAYTQATFGGIVISSQQNPNSVVFSTIINDNTISLFNNGTSSTSGIDFGHGLLTTTHIANNNIITIECGASVNNGAVHQGIKSQFITAINTISGNTISISQSGSGNYTNTVLFINANGRKGDITIQNNLLQSVNSHIKTSNIVYGISQNNIATGEVKIGGSLTTSNTINIQRSTPGTNFVFGIYTVEPTSTPTFFDISFNNITLSNLGGTNQGMGIYDFEGNSNTVKSINNNTINISGNNSGVTNGLYLSNGIFTVQNNAIVLNSESLSNAGIDFTINGTVNQALVENNQITITNAAISPTVRGIGTSITSVINNFTIRNNTIESITATATSGNPLLFGIRNNSGFNNVISNNIIKNITTVSGTNNALISGIDVSGIAINPTIKQNKIFNLDSFSSGTNSSVNGITVLLGSSTYTIYNNFISDLKSSVANSLTAVNGISCGTSNSTYKIYYNTIKLGTSAAPISGGANFSARGIAMLNNSSSTILDLRNNIIHVNATPSGNGYASCVAIASGTAGVVPTGFSTTSNNNIYFINSNVQNYLFVQGQNTTNLVNGFATSGLIQNSSNNIINDINFNASCGYYKTFMGGTLDSATYTEDNLIDGASIGTFIPTSNSFAENGAQAISSPSITTDFDNIARTPTNDIGALQFTGTSIIYTNPIVNASVVITASPAGEVPYTTNVTYTATPTNGGAFPTYQWYVNDVAVLGETNTTFTISTLEDYDVVTVKMVSDDNCAVDPNATSNEIIVNVIYPYDTNVINAQCGITLTAINQNVYANLIPSAQAYRFKVTDMVTNQVQIIDKALRVFQFTQLPVYAFGREYKVEVMVKIGGIWQHYGNPCSVSTPTVYTNLVNCGTTISLMKESINANIVPFASGYRFKITNTSTLTVDILDRPLRDFRMNLIPSPLFNTVYNVEVAVKNTDGTYLPYGPICTVTTPPVPLTQIIASQCGATLDMSTAVYAENFQNATTYRFKIENTTLGFMYIFDKPLRTFILSQVPGLLSGQTYEVSVSVEVGGAFGPYGSICPITINGSSLIKSILKDSTFDVVAYPNPYTENFNFRLTSVTNDEIQINVYDMIGKLIDNRIVNSNEINEINIGEEYPSGIYNIVVSQGENSKAVRIIKR